MLHCHEQIATVTNTDLIKSERRVEALRFGEVGVLFAGLACCLAKNPE
jgi:hypothetical protein